MEEIRRLNHSREEVEPWTGKKPLVGAANACNARSPYRDTVLSISLITNGYGHLSTSLTRKDAGEAAA